MNVDREEVGPAMTEKLRSAWVNVSSAGAIVCWRETLVCSPFQCELTPVTVPGLQAGLQSLVLAAPLFFLVFSFQLLSCGICWVLWFCRVPPLWTILPVTLWASGKPPELQAKKKPQCTHRVARRVFSPGGSICYLDFFIWSCSVTQHLTQNGNLLLSAVELGSKVATLILSWGAEHYSGLLRCCLVLSPSEGILTLKASLLPSASMQGVYPSQSEASTCQWLHEGTAASRCHSSGGCHGMNVSSKIHS